MPTCSFRDLEQVLKALGLEPFNSKKGIIWKGISPITRQLVSIVVHEHAGGRDIADGTLNKYVKDLGFKNYSEFKEFQNKTNK